MNQEKLQSELEAAFDQLENDPQSAQLAAEKAVLWAGRNGWMSTLAFANLVAGKASQVQHSFTSAIEYLQRANTLFKDLNDAEFVAKSYYAMGSVYVFMGEFSVAIDLLRKAISWLNRLDTSTALTLTIRIQLARALMNLGYWSDAEQELLSVTDVVDFDDVELAEYQLIVLRLAFYRGDQRTVREQMQLCQELVSSLETERLALAMAYFRARYIAKYERVRVGEAELAKLWQGVQSYDKNMFFNGYEAALDMLQSDYPQKGIHWLSLLLDEEECPLALQRQIHISLANFFVAHLSHELATEHFQEAERVAKAMRDSEVNQQWARYRADEAHQELRKQIAQQKKNNQILAESNALLQAVNRIAMAVNSSLDQESLIKRLREHLAGWIDAEIIAIAELKNDALHFNSLFEGERPLKANTIPLTETRSWSVRAVNEGRILYDNDFVLTDEILMDDSPNLVRSISFTPLKIENRVIGLLSLQSRRPNAFDSRSVSLLEYISPVIGIAFANLINLDRTRELSGELNKQQQELDDVRQLMAHMADHDELTGLPNRASLPDHFQHWIHNAPFHCIALRIVNLNEINNDVGFGSEDEIVRVIGQRLRNRVRPDDLLLRVASDQFLLFVNQMQGRDTLLEFAQQLLQLTEQPLRAKDQTVRANAAIGLVLYPEHGETLEEILSMISVAVSHAETDDASIFAIE